MQKSWQNYLTYYMTFAVCYCTLFVTGTVISKLIRYVSYTLFGILSSINTDTCSFYRNFSNHLNSGILIVTNNNKATHSEKV